MSARNRITVGKIEYQVYEDLIVPPDHLAPKGSIAIIIENERPNGIWIAKGNGKWDQLVALEVNANMAVEDDTTHYYEEGNYTAESWYPTIFTPNDLTWVEKSSSLATIVTEKIYPNVSGRFMVESNGHWYNQDAGVRWDIEASVAKNASLANSFGGATPAAAGFANIYTKDIIELDQYNQDFIQYGLRFTNTVSGDGFNPRNLSLELKLIDRPLYLLECNFEDTNKDTARMTIVNDDTNAWYKGEPAADLTAFSGDNCMYISNDNGVTWAYTNNLTQYSHFYFDIDIPNVPFSTWKVRLQWVGTGETTYDNLTIFLADQTYTPVAGEVPTGGQIIGPLATGDEWAEAIGIIEGAEGTNKRIIFTWKNDTSIGTEPIAVDNIAIFSYLDFENLWSVDFLEEWLSGSFAGNGWTVVDDPASVNYWVIGSDESFSGTDSAYITNDTPLTAQYDENDITTAHFYKDFTIDSSWATARLSLYWKCVGENGFSDTSYDYGLISLVPTTTTPVGAAELPVASRVGATDNSGKHNSLSSVWTKEVIALDDWIGDTVRLVFTWHNDGSIGGNPPFCVDNIKIEYK